MSSGEESNRIIVSVDDTDIRERDVMAAIQALPQQARQQDPQQLVPAVVQQLILRELVIEEARADGLVNDPEVEEMAGDGGEQATEQALVQVWLQRELDSRISGSDVEEAYADVQESNPDMDQPLSEVRSQIRQMLQRQEIQNVNVELREDADITFYDETGEPVDTSTVQ